MFILITRTLFLVPRAFPLEIGRGEKNPGDEVAKDRTVVVLLMRPRRSELFKKNCMIIFELLAREFVTVPASFEFERQACSSGRMLKPRNYHLNLKRKPNCFSNPSSNDD